MSDQSRRKPLKSIAAGSGAIVAGKSLPESWSRPMELLPLNTMKIKPTSTRKIRIQVPIPLMPLMIGLGVIAFSSTLAWAQDPRGSVPTPHWFTKIWEPLPLIDAHSQFDENVNLVQIKQHMRENCVVTTVLATRGLRQPVPNPPYGLHINPPYGPHIYYNPRPSIIHALRTKSGKGNESSDAFSLYLNRQLEFDDLYHLHPRPLFNAMGEVLMYHGEKKTGAVEVFFLPDDDRVSTAMTVARDRKWPFIAHIEFAGLERDYGEAERTDYMWKFKTFLRKNSDHPVILIHMGQLETLEVQMLLEQHPNLYFMTSHANFIVNEGSVEPWTEMFDNTGNLTWEWSWLIKRFPKRFIFALDNVYKKHWGWEPDLYAQQVKLWRRALKMLQREWEGEVAHAVAYRNAMRLFGITPPAPCWYRPAPLYPQPGPLYPQVRP